MSTILKALRRLEKEKAPGQRPLREQVASAGGDGGDGPPRRWPILLAGIGAGVVAGLAVLFLLLFRGGTPEQTPSAAPAPPAEAVAKAPPAPAQPAAPVRRGRLRPSPPAQPPVAARATPPAVAPPAEPGVEVAEEVEVVDRGAAPPRIAVESEPAPGGEAGAPRPGSVRPFQRPDPKALPGRHLLPEGPSLPAQAPEAAAAAQPPAPAPAPVDRAEPAAAVATPRAAPAPPVVAPAPELARAAPARPAAEAPKPPAATRSPAPPAPAFPALRVERTTWHPLAERRVAVVEVADEGTQSVREGEAVAGAVVRRIEPSGVVFEHAGREVRRKIGEP